MLDGDLSRATVLLLYTLPLPPGFGEEVTSKGNHSAEGSPFQGSAGTPGVLCLTCVIEIPKDRILALTDSGRNLQCLGAPGPFSRQLRSDVTGTLRLLAEAAAAQRRLQYDSPRSSAGRLVTSAAPWIPSAAAGAHAGNGQG